MLGDHMTKDNKKSIEEKEHILEARIRGGIYAVILCTIMIAISVVIYVTIEADILRELDEVQFEALNYMEEEIHHTIEDAVTYVHHISAVPQTIRVFSGDLNALRDSQMTFKEIVEYTDFVDKLRLIGVNGEERISVWEQANGSAVIRDDENLENLSKQSFFTTTIGLDQEIIYVSDLDLEMSNGTYSKPYRPLLRISTSLIKDNKSLGVLVLSYKAESLYKVIGSHITHTDDTWYLIDKNGYYLKGPSSDVEYGSVVGERKKFGIFNDNPNAWSEMRTWDEGKTEVEDGWLYYKRVCPINENVNLSGCKNWYVTINVPKVSIKEEVSRIVLGLQIGNVVLIPLLAGLGWSLGNAQIRNKYYKKKLENQARIDPLTGLYNRRFIGEMLDQHIQMAMRREEELSVIYVDLNDLKRVNDMHGHELGDIMIKEAAHAMKVNIRKTDEIARLGGDEFMIVLPDCSTEQINSIMSRVIEKFMKAGTDHVKEEWTLSWGASSWMGEEDSVQSLINRADSAMYSHKRTFKQQKDFEES